MSSGGVSPDAVREDAHGHVRPVPRAEHSFYAGSATSRADHGYCLVALTSKTRPVILLKYTIYMYNFNTRRNTELVYFIIITFNFNNLYLIEF